MTSKGKEPFFKRSYIRHPSDIPLDYHLGDKVQLKREHLNNVGHGGLSFSTNEAIEPGTIIYLKIPLTNPVFAGTGLVVWCQKKSSGYAIGVEFTETDVEFRMRMVEQICHIEHYKHKVYENEGRLVTGEEAACEWVSKFAKNFPKLRNTGQ